MEHLIEDLVNCLDEYQDVSKILQEHRDKYEGHDFSYHFHSEIQAIRDAKYNLSKALIAIIDARVNEILTEREIK